MATNVDVNAMQQQFPVDSNPRSASPTPRVSKNLEPPPPEFTILDEANSKLEVLYSKRGVISAEIELVQRRKQECEASERLYNIQKSLFERKVLENDMEIDKAINELALLKSSAHAILSGKNDGVWMFAAMPN